MMRFCVLTVLCVACSADPSLQASASVLGSTSARDHGDALNADWPMYGHDLGRSFANRASGLNPKNVRGLHQQWFFPSSDLFTAQAAVVAGVVYIGGWDGYFYALDQETGDMRWSFAVDCQNAVLPVPPRCLAPGEPPPPGREHTDGGLITSSAAVVGGTVYFGGGRTLYALDAATGALRWKHLVCGNPDDPGCADDANDQLLIFSSPAVYHGQVFIGVSANGQDGYRGAFLAFDAQTGAQRWRFEIDPVLDAMGNPVLNAQGLPAAGRNRGCGNVWSSASIDADHDTVAFGTADCDFGADPPYHSGVLALDATTGRLRWAFTPHANDQTTCDFDFGATANRILQGSKTYFGIGGKDGTYYLLDANTSDRHGHASWSTNVVFGGSAGGFYGGAAYDGTRSYSATGFGDFFACAPNNPRDQPFQESSVHALDARTGHVAWEGQRAWSFAATTAGDGVVFTTFPGTPFGDPSLVHVYRTDDGFELVRLALHSSTSAPATPIAGMVIIPVGNYTDGVGGGVAGFRID